MQWIKDIIPTSLSPLPYRINAMALTSRFRIGHKGLYSGIIGILGKSASSRNFRFLVLSLSFPDPSSTVSTTLLIRWPQFKSIKPNNQTIKEPSNQATSQRASHQPSMWRYERKAKKNDYQIRHSPFACADEILLTANNSANSRIKINSCHFYGKGIVRPKW